MCKEILSNLHIEVVNSKKDVGVLLCSEEFLFSSSPKAVISFPVIIEETGLEHKNQN